MTTLDRHGRPASTSQRDTAPRPLTHHRHRKAGRSRTVRLRSLGTPSVRSGRDVPPRPDLPPSGAQSLRRTDRPRAQRATGNGCPLAWVDSCAVHAARDTGAFDQSILKKSALCKSQCAGGGASGRAAHLPLVTIRPPQAAALSVKIGNKAGGTEGREPSLHMDASASILRPLSPYGPGQRGLPPYPCFPALRCCGSSGRKGNNVLRDRGTGGLAALPAVGTTTAASEQGAG